MNIKAGIRPEEAIELLREVARQDLTSPGHLDHCDWEAEWVRDNGAAHVRLLAPRRCDPMETVSVLVAFVRARFVCLKCDHGAISEFHFRIKPLAPAIVYLETAADGSDRLVRVAA